MPTYSTTDLWLTRLFSFSLSLSLVHATISLLSTFLSRLQQSLLLLALSLLVLTYSYSYESDLPPHLIKMMRKVWPVTQNLRCSAAFHAQG